MITIQKKRRKKFAAYFTKGSACAAERKSVNPLLAGGCAACRLSLSVHKQTSPIDIDHFESAPEFQMWIKIIRTPNTADRNY